MWYVHEVAVAKDIRQAVLAGVRLFVRHLLRRPKVPPPRHKRQRNENRQEYCYENYPQSISPHARDNDTPEVSKTLRVCTSNDNSVRWLSMVKAGG